MCHIHDGPSPHNRQYFDMSPLHDNMVRPNPKITLGVVFHRDNDQVGQNIDIHCIGSTLLQSNASCSDEEVMHDIDIQSIHAPCPPTDSSISYQYIYEPTQNRIVDDDADFEQASFGIGYSPVVTNEGDGTKTI